MDILLNLFAFLSPLLLLLGIGIKFARIANQPVHVRWEIYDIPSAKRGEAEHAGSYLEEIDWMKKEPKKNLLVEFVEPLKEIFFLHRVKKFNIYGLWIWSLFLHWGIWLLFLWVFLVLLNATLYSFNLENLIFIAYLSYGFGVLGSLGLFVKRISNKELKLYTSGIDYVNLFFLFLLFFTGLLMIQLDDYSNEVLSYMKGIVSFTLQSENFSTLTLLHFLIFEIFLLYIPFSKFFHGPVKFFTFHKILWNDSYQKKGSREEKKIMQQLNYKVKWAAPHILPEKSWLENAQNTNFDEK